jgi:poly(A) polymerase
VQPKIYSLEEHSIQAKHIDSHAYYVIEKLRKAGHIAYLVGGSVRDILLNLQPKDFDISTSAEPSEIKKLFYNCILIGRRFRLAHIRFGRKILEVSTFRSGDTEETSLILRDNVWGSEEQDVLRRDFTINGLFYDPETQTIIDYVGGFKDAKNKILRSIGKAEVRFIQDPVRMIRLLKFCARLGFTIEQQTHEDLLTCKEEIIKSSSARILEELFRMLESGASKVFFQLLTEYGLLFKLLPLLADALIEGKENNISPFLKEIDDYHKNNPRRPLHRPILISCFLFPLLEKRLKLHFLDKNKNIHLGIISDEASELISDVFSPFFHLPRKIKASIISILVNQFRFFPIDRNQKKRIRTPKDPFFNMALSFLSIRCKIYPELQSTYEKWQQKNRPFIKKKLKKI